MDESTENLRVLTRTQVDTYWRDGWVSREGLFDAGDVESWREECAHVWAGLDVESDDPRIQWRGGGDGEKVADRIDPLLDMSPLFNRLSTDPRLLGAVADLIGAAPDVLKGKVIMKRPGTMGYSAHQDYPYYQFLNIPAQEFVIVSVPLDVSNAESGAMEVFSGMHDTVLPAPADDPLDVDESRAHLGQGDFIELAPGDIALFHGLLPHRSGPNRSPHSRRVLYFSYVKGGYEDIYARYHAKRPAYRMKRER